MSNEKKKTVKSAYYDDDYVEHGVVKETETTPQVVFSFKPLNMIQSSKLTDEVMKDKTIESAAIATLDMISRQLVNWDVTKPNGEKVDFTKVAELKKMDPLVMNEIARAIRKDKSSPEADIKALTNAIKNS